ncbi:amidohydrolase family protein [Amycolatopsis thermoflava]
MISTTAAPQPTTPACDAHIHALDPRFPGRGAWQEFTAPPGLTIDDYLAARRPFGTQRAVIVQSKVYGTDNSCLIDALERLGDDGRGIAVVRPDVPGPELRDLHTAGVRGIRFSLWNTRNAVVDAGMIEPLARRVADLGWHVQVHLSGEQIIRYADLLTHIPCPLVLDHMARLPPAESVAGPAVDVVLRLLDGGRTWVKLAGPYLNSLDPVADAERGDYPHATRVAQLLVRAAPDRLVWGSDWPHVTERQRRPDDAALAALLRTWAPDPLVRARILRLNPAELYDFG